MARHLYIGNAVAATYSSGVLAAGAIDIQKMSSSGPTSLVALETITDAPQIRIVQGNGTTNIISPWICGKDVINWSGKSYVAGVAHRTDSTLTSNTAAISFVTTKIYRIDTDSFENFSFDTGNIASGQTPTQVQVIVLAAWDAILAVNKPDWLNDVATVAAGVFQVTATKRGDTTNSGSLWDEKNVIIEMIQTHSADTTQTHGNAIGVNMLVGYGDGYWVKAMEEETRGVNYGYYNRIQLPNTPTTTAVATSNYDVYNIACTKDGSSSSQIHGVDNLIELNIAFDNGTAALTLALEGILNPYLASANFPVVVL